MAIPPTLLSLPKITAHFPIPECKARHQEPVEDALPDTARTRHGVHSSQWEGILLLRGFGVASTCGWGELDFGMRVLDASISLSLRESEG